MTISNLNIYNVLSIIIEYYSRVTYVMKIYINLYQFPKSSIYIINIYILTSI
jgi:hypothetical protein